MQTLRFALSLFGTTLKASMALRTAFLLQASFMVLNNTIMFTVWWVLFERFEQIRGYRLPDMLALYGVAAAGYGLAMVTCGGMLEIARLIADGELDPLLAQPKSVLLRTLAVRSSPAGWGDLATGCVMLGLSGYVRWSTLPVAMLATLLAALGFVASAVLLHSSAFWLGRVESVARMFFHFVLAFTLYPPTLFEGGLKLVLYTLIPAGIIAYLPVELVRNFDLRTAAISVSAVASYALLACWLFTRGLRHYASGSRFGVWG